MTPLSDSNSDPELIQAVINGDQEAFRLFVERY